jgi:muramidase (phage lysozyme)
MSQERQILESWAKQNPGLFSGLKQAISGAEGTILGGKPGYNVMFGGGKFKDFSRHPDRVISSPGGYSSAAAGAYQFMPGTWSGVQKSLGLPDFSPQSQDIGMLKKVRERLMPLGGLSAISKAGTLTSEIQAALAPEWASFPTQSGKSYYGQPVKKAEQIQRFFQEGMRGAAPTAPALPTPSTTTAGAIQKGNQQAGSLLQSIMKYIPMAGSFPGLSSLPAAEQLPLPDSQDFLNAYKMFFNEEEEA